MRDSEENGQYLKIDDYLKIFKGGFQNYKTNKFLVIRKKFQAIEKCNYKEEILHTLPP